MRKAQAAMEFLMTYGWAMLVILIVIAALAFFGLLTPSKFLPDRCLMETGFSCLDYKVQSSDTNTVSIVIQNMQGEDASNVVISIDDCNSDSVVANELNVTIPEGKSSVFTFNCPTPTSSTRFKTQFMMQYTSGRYSHNTTGSLITRVE